MTVRGREGARSRGYDGRWDKAISTYKQRHPYCLGCAAVGLRTKTDVVDHVIPHKGNQSVFWDTAAWQPACRHHHDIIKKQLETLWERGELQAAALWLDSPQAIDMTKRRMPPRPLGADGWPIE